MSEKFTGIGCVISHKNGAVEIIYGDGSTEMIRPPTKPPPNIPQTKPATRTAGKEAPPTWSYFMGQMIVALIAAACFVAGLLVGGREKAAEPQVKPMTYEVHNHTGYPITIWPSPEGPYFKPTKHTNVYFNFNTGASVTNIGTVHRMLTTGDIDENGYLKRIAK